MTSITTKKEKFTTKQITITALFTALIFLITRFIQIPIPLGYFNIGNSIILLLCILVPSPLGILAGSLGSALADLTSFPVYTIPTLIIKALFPFLFYVLMKLPIKNNFIKTIIAASISTLIPLLGYTLTGAILYGSFLTGLAQFPGLFVEYIANLILFIIFEQTTKKVFTSL